MKTIYLGLFLFCTICVHVGLSAESAPEVEEEEDVMVLTEKNFEHAVESNKHVLVEFCKYKFCVCTF